MTVRSDASKASNWPDKRFLAARLKSSVFVSNEPQSRTGKLRGLGETQTLFV